MFRKLKQKSMDLLSFMSSFKCCKNFPLKINFSGSNFLEVYAVVHYTENNLSGIWRKCERSYINLEALQKVAESIQWPIFGPEDTSSRLF